MFNKKNLFAVFLLTVVFFTTTVKAQVTIGAQRAAKSTLEVVTLPDGSTTPNGIIPPRLTLAQLNAKKAQYTSDQTGAMVYITDASGATITGYSDLITCTGLVFFNGVNWVSNCAPPEKYAAITSQPERFFFYEQGTETIRPIVFGAEGSSAMSYQWYKIVGNNINVRISQPCTSSDGTGFNTSSFTPTSVRKGSTNDARNTGYYRYYCVATNQTANSVVSDVVEVIVGCGAKTVYGNWVTFMCFNLGATPQTMAAQKSAAITLTTNSSVTNAYKRSSNERTVYGDLFQWGRIADGHENRDKIPVNNTGGVDATDNCANWNTSSPPTYENGNALGTLGHYYPQQQVAKSSTAYYGKFIKTIVNYNYNWYSVTATSGENNTQNAADILWRERALGCNDPCQKINSDGTSYTTFYPIANANSTAGGSSGTGWRLPNQEEWSMIYRGGSTCGAPEDAAANTWAWYTGATNGSRGYEVKPDNVNTTLFLPASGYRDGRLALLIRSGTDGYYWSGRVSGMSAFGVSIDSENVSPAFSGYRSNGFAIRCIKD